MARTSQTGRWYCRRYARQMHHAIQDLRASLIENRIEETKQGRWSFRHHGQHCVAAEREAARSVALFQESLIIESWEESRPATTVLTDERDIAVRDQGIGLAK